MEHFGKLNNQIYFYQKRTSVYHQDFGYTLKINNFEDNKDIPVRNAFAGVNENFLCRGRNCPGRSEIRKNTKQNGQMFTTKDRDNDKYCRCVKVNFCFIGKASGPEITVSSDLSRINATELLNTEKKTKLANCRTQIRIVPLRY